MITVFSLVKDIASDLLTGKASNSISELFQNRKEERRLIEEFASRTLTYISTCGYSKTDHLYSIKTFFNSKDNLSLALLCRDKQVPDDISRLINRFQKHTSSAFLVGFDYEKCVDYLLGISRISRMDASATVGAEVNMRSLKLLILSEEYRVPRITDKWIDVDGYTQTIVKTTSEQHKLLITGKPGSGKTTLLIAALRANESNAPNRLWISCDDSDTVDLLQRKILEAVGCMAYQDSEEVLKGQVVAALRLANNPVLILDNLPENIDDSFSEVLFGLVGDIIVTSRRKHFGHFYSLEAPRFSASDARSLYEHYATTLLDDSQYLDEIFEYCDFLPFAIELVARYQARMHCTVSALRDKLYSSEVTTSTVVKIRAARVDHWNTSSVIDHLSELYRSLLDINREETILLSAASLFAGYPVTVHWLLAFLGWSEEKMAMVDDLINKRIIDTFQYEEDPQLFLIRMPYIMHEILRHNSIYIDDQMQSVMEKIALIMQQMNHIADHYPILENPCRIAAINALNRFPDFYDEGDHLRMEIARSHKKYARFPQAISQLDAMLEDARFADDDHRSYYVRLTLATIYYEMGSLSDSEKAAHLLSARFPDECKVDRAYKELQINLLIGAGLYENAICEHEKMKPLIREDELYGYYQHRAVMLAYNDENEESVKYSKLSIAERIKSGVTSEVSLGVVLSTLCAGYAGMKNYEFARIAGERAVSLLQDIGHSHNHTLSAYGNLAGVYYLSGDFKKAHALCELILKNSTEIFVGASRALLNAYHLLGACEYKFGHKIKARTKYRTALSLALSDNRVSHLYYSIAIEYANDMIENGDVSELHDFLSEVNPFFLLYVRQCP